MGLGLRELLGKTEIDSTLSNAHEEVVRFDIAMNEVSRVSRNIVGNRMGERTHRLPSQIHMDPSRTDSI